MNRFGRIIHIALCMAVGLLFVYAGGSKLRNLDEFAEAVASFQLVPEKMAYPIAITVPAIECLSGIGVLIPWTRRVGLLSLLLLTLLFSGVLISAAMKGVNLECGCFGPVSGNAADPRLLLVRNGGIAALLGYLYFYELRSFGTSAHSKQGRWFSRKRS